ncbi:MAG: 23S rRNA (adenine(2503)-C(2))-methyltransferase RlmN [Opitutae bacterium]|jgi:23S rRNA (adenine2503-C2)-methyltransferase|nr:23S rRNA (adenine(2503)-C(2))-methyltransferase RlmN [Opitutae bacterium]
MRFIPKKKSLLGESLEDFESDILAADFPKYRAKQVFDWVFKKRISDLALMKNLPKPLIEWLDANYVIDPTQILLDKQSNDVTQKFLIQLEDKRLIETVLIRAPQEGVGVDKSRKTVCVSIQVGCAYGCKFCASGLAGFKRNLYASEVIAQLLHMSRLDSPDEPNEAKESVSFDNIVFMGMGEPLANYNELVSVLKIMNASWGLNIGARRITVSTSGLAPEIEKLANEGISIRLAISLHGATNEVRNQIMPINKRYPLEVLIPAIEKFREKHGRMVTLEFILIDGVNDGLDQARALVKIAKRLHAHVNCIPYNKVEGLEWKRPSITRQNKFVQVLKDANVSVTIRREKGHSINAACGQLRLKKEIEMAKEELTPSSPFIKPNLSN